jgi:mono/diheme cytochrome c family protein
MIWAALLLAQAAGSPDTVARGSRIFAESCSVGYCHGKGGAASRGPRLRGRTFERSYLERAIRDGIPNSAMPGWKGRLKDEDIAAVIEYVASLATVSNDAEPAASAATGPTPAPAFRGTPEAERGYALFFDATRETHCGTCHVAGGRGIAVGPDVGGIAGKSSAEIGAALRATRARRVITMRLRGGESFPALRVSQQGEIVKVYDLTTPPPVLRTLTRGEILSATEGAEWSHATYMQGYTGAEVADLIAYLRTR